MKKDVEYGWHERHVMDIYEPSGTGPYPVVLYIHGGGWKEGSKDLYSHLGNWLARHGIVACLINYRLTPEVKHPEHVRDCALALAWLHSHVDLYNGDPGRMYLTGYSAGGHLAALLATDPVYLAEHDLGRDVIKGVVTLSGVYVVNYLLDIVGYGAAFPYACRQQASPLSHIGPGLPPWVVVFAINDYKTLDWQAKKLYFALLEAGCKARLLIFDSDHPLLTENLVNDKQAVTLIRFFRDIKNEGC
jgi:acetyl esterase/lipase